MPDLTDILCDSGQTTQELATAAGVELRSGYRFLGGQYPKLAAFRRMLSRASRLPLAVKKQMLDWLCDGSAFAVVEVDGPTLAERDANLNRRDDRPDAQFHGRRAAQAYLEFVTLLEERDDHPAACRKLAEAQRHGWLAGESCKRVA